MADGPDPLPPYLKHLVVLQFSGLSTDESFAIKEERPPSIIVDDEVPITTDMDCGLRKGGGRGEKGEERGERGEGRGERGEGRRGKGRRGKGRGKRGEESKGERERGMKKEIINC